MENNYNNLTYISASYSASTDTVAMGNEGYASYASYYGAIGLVIEN